MKKILFNSNNDIRNGWWIVLFISLIVLTQFIYKPITTGLKTLSLPQGIVEATSVILVLLVTYLCLRFRKESLKDVGMRIDGSWLKIFFAGVIVGGLWLLAVVFPIWLTGGVSFELNPEWSFKTLGAGFYAFLLAGLLEELLHRGFIFQRLIDGLGFWQAQLIMAVLFAFGHLDNPQMDGLTMVMAVVDLALASLVFGLAYQRTKSLALPIGLHIGWNWVQGNVMGFNVSGYEANGWLKATISEQADWLTGGQFGVEGSLYSILMSLAVLFLIWRWKKRNSTHSFSNNKAGNLEAAI